jgi:ribulose-phosphate 3-epimerase
MLDYILNDIDMVLLMTVNPGFGGQSFIRSSLDKIRRLKSVIDSKGVNVDIQVDGGINLNNLSEVAEAGANIFVAGSAVFGAEDVEGTVRKFKEMVI